MNYRPGPDTKDHGGETRSASGPMPPTYRCSTPGCPGDPNYAPPGKGHVEGCQGHPEPAPPPSLRDEVRAQLWEAFPGATTRQIHSAADAVLGVLRTRIKALPDHPLHYPCGEYCEGWRAARDHMLALFEADA